MFLDPGLMHCHIIMHIYTYAHADYTEQALQQVHLPHFKSNLRSNFHKGVEVTPGGGHPQNIVIVCLECLTLPRTTEENEMSQFVTYDEYNVLHLIAEDFQWTMTLLDGWVETDS